MCKNVIFSILFFCTSVFHLTAQETLPLSNVTRSVVKGFHVGVVQPLFSLQKGEFTSFFDYDVYTIGFPTGITLTTNSKILFDFEIVPFIAPALQVRENFEVHILYHPGILIPLGNNFTFGFRLAFESGKGQFGGTPLINKSFPLSKGSNYFIELVLPFRFGPNEKSGFTQIVGLHTGLAF